MTFRLVGGDAIGAMQAMAENSVDAIVTDPPYGLEFMGKEWDRLAVGPNADRWEGRRTAGDTPTRDITSPGGRSGAVVSASKPNPKCRLCGHYRFSGTPCACAVPEWEARANPQARIMQEWHHAWATEALRILKPGGHLLAFGGTRTYHRLACAIEDAGFEIRDCIAWMYGSGFPKSLDVSKAIDKAAGAERTEVVGSRGLARWKDGAPAGVAMKDDGGIRQPFDEVDELRAPATPEAQRWNGWGTALKPAFEPIVLARKPLAERNVAANVQRWGTGALNIDGCRIEFDGAADEAESKGKNRHEDYGSGEVNGYHGWESRAAGGNYNPPGRWPANVTLDETAAAMLDEQTGELHTQDPRTRRGSNSPGRVNGSGETGWAAAAMTAYGDTGGASRFFYCPKADREERNRGLEGFEERRAPKMDGGEWHPEGRNVEGTAIALRNHHPTVKPVELMRWLCRMVTPPKGTVLDPFCGSGSTGVAAMREGFEFIGIEREAEYLEIARSRIYGDSPLFNVEVGGGPTE